MARVIINVPVSTYSREQTRFVLPPMSDEQANSVMNVLARAQRCSVDRLGGEGFNITDATGVVSTEITADESVVSRKDFAMMSAEHKRKEAERATEEANQAREKAELMTA